MRQASFAQTALSKFDIKRNGFRRSMHITWINDNFETIAEFVTFCLLPELLAVQLNARSPLSSHRHSCIMSATLASHQHGKSRVRLGRVWREGNTHHMVEWTVFSMLESDMAHAFTGGSNADMTATDTQKNTASWT